MVFSIAIVVITWTQLLLELQLLAKSVETNPAIAIIEIITKKSVLLLFKIFHRRATYHKG